MIGAVRADFEPMARSQIARVLMLLALTNLCFSFIPNEIEAAASGETAFPDRSCTDDSCSVATTTEARFVTSFGSTSTEEGECSACYNYTAASASYWGNTDEARLPCSSYEDATRVQEPRWYRLSAASFGESKNGAIVMEWCAPSEYCTKGYRLWLDHGKTRSFQQRSTSCDKSVGVLCLSPANVLYRNRCDKPLRDVQVLTCREHNSPDQWQVYRMPVERVCAMSYCVRDPGDKIPPKPYTMCDQLQKRWEEFKRGQTIIAARDVSVLLEKGITTISLKQLRTDYYTLEKIKYVESVLLNDIVNMLLEQVQKRAESKRNWLSRLFRRGDMHSGLNAKQGTEDALYNVKLVNVIDVIRIVDQQGAVLSGDDYATWLLKDSVELSREFLQLTLAVFVDSATNSPLFVQQYEPPKSLLAAPKNGKWYLLDSSVLQSASTRLNMTLTTASFAIANWSYALPVDMVRQVQLIRNATQAAAANSDPWAGVKAHLNFFIAVGVVFGLCSFAILLLYLSYRVQRYRQTRQRATRLTSPSLRSETSVRAETSVKVNDTAAELPSAFESPITLSTANLVAAEPHKGKKDKSKKGKAKNGNAQANAALDAGDIVPVSEQRYASYAEVEVHRQDLSYHNGAHFGGTDGYDTNDKSFASDAQDLSAVTKL